MDRSVIILALGDSKGFNQDKGTVLVDGKPLLRRIIEAVKNAADETIIVVSSQEQADAYQKLLSPKVKFVVSNNDNGTLGFVISGLEAAEGDYSLLLPYDSPFVSSEVVSLLFDLSCGKTAVVPRSPDCDAEALHAVYNTQQALETSRAALAEGDCDIEALTERLRCIRYVSTMVIEQLDAELKTFFRVITPLDLRKAAVLSKPKKTKKQPNSPKKR